MSPPDPPDLPRHPSAGNLERSPRLVDDPAAEAVTPLAFPSGAEPTPGEVTLGPGLAPEAASRLLGHLEGKRVLEMGCGTGDLAVLLARAGAKVIATEPDAELVAEAREAAEAATVKVEFHHGDPADLAFLRNDHVDLAVSVFTLSGVDDLDRVFRQVHRVLRSEAPLLFSLPHPLALMAALRGKDAAPTLERTYFDPAPVEWRTPDRTGSTFPHGIGEVVTSMARSGFRVDLVAEPRPTDTDSAHWTPEAEWVPTTVTYRGRKQGV